MADQDMSLSVDITGDAGGAVSALQQTTAAMDKVPQSVNVSQASLDRLSSALDGIVKQHGLVADSTGKASAGIESVAKSASTAAKEGGEFNSVGGDMARMFSTLGVESGAAAGRIGAFAGALDSLKTAAPEIIAVVAGATAAIAGFEFGKSAIESASALQDSMTRLGQVVKDQGGNWNLLSQQVKDFADAQIASTTYTDTAVVNSIERLVASGMSLADSMTSTRIAEDLAAGSGRSLEESTNSLIEAQHGRLMGLEAMGVLTKQQVKDGQTYDQVLQQIEDHMGGSALSATQTYSGAMSSLGAQWTKLLEDAGTPFLALLTSIVQGMGPVVDTIDADLQPAFAAISDWAKNEAPAIRDFFSGLADSIHIASDAFNNTLGPALHDTFDSIEKLGEALSPFLTGQLDTMNDTLNDGAKGWDTYDKAISLVINTVGDLVKMLGEGIQAISDLINAGSQLGDWVNQQVAKLGPLGKAVAFAEDPNAVGAPNDSSGVMPAFHNFAGAYPAGYSAPSTNPTTTTTYNPQLGGPMTHGGSSHGGGSGAAGTQPVGSGSADVSFDPLAGVIPSTEAITGVLDTFYANLQSKDDAATAKLNVDWENFTNQSDEKMNEDLATFSMTNDQKVAYYGDALAKMLQSDTGSLNEREHLYTEYTNSLEAADKQRFQEEQQAENQFESSAQSHMSSFLDAIIVEHKSMANELKSVYQDIEKYFIDMIAKMLAEAMMALPWIQALLGGGAGGGGGALDLSMIGPGLNLPGMGSSAVLGGGGGGGVPPVSGGASSPLGAALRTMSPNLGGGGTMPNFGGGGGVPDFGAGSGGGSGGGSMPDFGSGGYGLGGGSNYGGGGAPPASGGASGGGFMGASYNFGPHTSPNSGGVGMLAGLLGRSGLGSLFGVGMGGDMLGSLAFGNKGYSGAGGAIGGLGILGLESLFGGTSLAGALPALLASGPLGWGVLLGSVLLGAFAGSMFGDHFNPANEPDQGPTQDAWGIANADMQGMTASNPMNANGKQYVMDSQTASATGGRGWNVLFEKFVQQYRGNLKTLPYALQAAFPNIESLWGGATDHPDFNPDGKDGYLDIGSGKRALWTDFWGAVQNYGQDISQLMQGQTPTEMYVANVNGLLRSGGSTTPGPGGNDSPFERGGPMMGGNSNAIISGGAGRIGASLAQRLSQSISLNINVRNSSTLADTANLERALRDAFGTTLPSLMEDLNYR